MNAPRLPAPCESFEHEIADLVDGLLNEVDARRIQLHVASCAACHAWHDEYAALDRELHVTLPAPELSADFDAQLRARIRTLAVNGRAERKAAADAEHDAVLAGLRRDSQRRALLGALGGGIGVVTLALFAHSLVQHAPVLQSVLGGPDRVLVAVAVSAAAVAGALGWTFSRTTIAVPRLMRR